MKKLSAFISVLFYFGVHAEPISPVRRNTSDVPPSFFIHPYVQCQYFFYKEQEGTLGVKFPYALVDGTTSTPHTFSSLKHNITGAGKFSYTFPGLEIGYGRFSVDANMNLATGPVFGWTDNFYCGVNFRLPFPYALFSKKWTEAPGAAFLSLYSSDQPWQVLVHFGVQYYHPLYELGEINTAGSHFVAAGYSLPSLDSTINAPGKVNVYFQQNTISLAPALELAYVPVDRQIHIGIRVAPLVMISQEGGLRFRYKNSLQDQVHAPPGYNLHYIPLDAGAIETTYNGARISETPFSLKGYMISFSIGFRLGGD